MRYTPDPFLHLFQYISAQNYPKHWAAMAGTSRLSDSPSTDLEWEQGLFTQAEGTKPLCPVQRGYPMLPLGLRASPGGIWFMPTAMKPVCPLLRKLTVGGHRASSQIRVFLSDMIALDFIKLPAEDRQVFMFWSRRTKPSSNLVTWLEESF